jgi:NlpC/P60 family protein
MRFTFGLLLLFGIISCNNSESDANPADRMDSVAKSDSINVISVSNVTNVSKIDTLASQITPNNQRSEIVDFAETFIGTPYRYGSKDPSVGFDCSGFIYYVFSHFDIKVPRSSVEYTNLGMEVSVQDAKPGDLILFTGTDSTIRVVGHIGIITENTDTLRFIQATSGKAYAVVITPFEQYYESRFIKIIDILPVNTTPVVDKTRVIDKIKTETITTETVVTKTISSKHPYPIHHRLISKHHHLAITHHHSSKVHQHLVKVNRHSKKHQSIIVHHLVKKDLRKHQLHKLKRITRK